MFYLMSPDRGLKPRYSGGITPRSIIVLFNAPRQGTETHDVQRTHLLGNDKFYLMRPDRGLKHFKGFISNAIGRKVLFNAPRQGTETLQGRPIIQ